MRARQPDLPTRRTAPPSPRPEPPVTRTPWDASSPMEAALGRAGLRLDGLLGLLRLVDQLLRDMRGHLLVAQEVHGIVAAAAGQRGERLGVREDLRHRYLGLDHRHPRGRLHTLQAPAP